MGSFGCHTSSELTCYVCVKCFNIFHKSCAGRDWQSDLIWVDGHKVLCCTDDIEGSTFAELMDILNGKDDLEQNKDNHIMETTIEEQNVVIATLEANAQKKPILKNSNTQTQFFCNDTSTETEVDNSLKVIPNEVIDDAEKKKSKKIKFHDKMFKRGQAPKARNNGNFENLEPEEWIEESIHGEDKGSIKTDE
ncbi:hypothetical protein HHI36_002532 [Cryptolaemus montrouzieri]|uniref:Zinc finger PHD-type domain-containing protein n=1 Tax=Cryptolaemus montrouzieri TaxID=559131 RepID=A0ABD2PBP0_9CUCU